VGGEGKWLIIRAKRERGGDHSWVTAKCRPIPKVWPRKPPEHRCGRELRETGDLAIGAGEQWAAAQAVLHVFDSDCQQISAHPSERNASWMSARLSYRTRKRRN
jgi:hypothetical protein